MRTHSAILVFVLGLAVAGCGNSGGTTSVAVQKESIADGVRAPSSREITDADINRAKDASASRAFLVQWSDLQWQNWVEAVDRYSPGLRRLVGSRRIFEALKFQASLYRSVKPMIQGESARRGLTTVRFAYSDQSGARRLSSTIWRQEQGRWTLVFDALLEVGLQSWAQTRAQQTLDPDALKPSKRALKAGIEAFELQGKYLQFLRPVPLAPRGRAGTVE